jgi:hypothetical protein
MKSGWKKILSILLLALWVNLPAAEKNRMELGINLSNPGLYWETETVFADAMKSSRHWDKGGENWAKTDEKLLADRGRERNRLRAFGRLHGDLPAEF